MTVECIFNIGYYGDCKVVIKSLTNNVDSSYVITQNGSNANTISKVIYLDPGRYQIRGYDWNHSIKGSFMCLPVRMSINVTTCKPIPSTKTSTNVTPTPGTKTFGYNVKPFLFYLGGAEQPHSHNFGAIIGGPVCGVIVLIIVVIIIGIIYYFFKRSV